MEDRCPCGETAAYTCLDCQGRLCPDHFCAACERCDRHCVCAYRFWIPFDFV